MARTTGLVQMLKVTTSTFFVVAYIGSTPTNVLALCISNLAGLSPHEIAARTEMASLLRVALTERLRVTLTHPDDGGEILAVEASRS